MRTGTSVVVLDTAELLESGRPATGAQIDMHGIGKRHALPHQELTLSIGAAKGEALTDTAVGKHHAVAGNLARAGVAMQRIAHIARAPRTTGEQRHLTVRGDHPLGNLLDHLVHPLKKALRCYRLPLSARNSIKQMIPRGRQGSRSFEASMRPMVHNPAVAEESHGMAGSVCPDKTWQNKPVPFWEVS